MLRLTKLSNLWLKMGLIISLCYGLTACAPAPVQKKTINKAPVQPTSLLNLSKQLPLGHAVKAGERLQDIAKQYRQTISQLIAWNQLRPPYQLFAGQILQVSAVGGAWTALSKQRQLQAADLKQISSINAYSNQQPRAHAWQWPSRGKLERTHSKTGRHGLNIYGRYQQTIYASADGEVLYSGKGLTGYDGHLIILRHPSSCLSVYAHNQDKAAVSQGAKVRAGEPIALMGYNSQQKPSLHFEISCAEKTLDPLSLLQH